MFREIVSLGGSNDEDFMRVSIIVTSDDFEVISWS